MRKIVFAVALLPAAALALALTVNRALRHPAPVAPAVTTAYASVPPQAPVRPSTPADDLPTVAVTPYSVHAAPSDENSLPARPYTMVPLPGRTAQRALAQIQPPRSAAAPVSLQPASLSGRAVAAAGTALDIEGRRVALFGIKPLLHDDGAAARAVLQRRVAGVSITCNAPPGQGSSAEFICRDAAGTDLGGFLVAQGLVAADRSKSYQYVDDEDRARAQRLGGWR